MENEINPFLISGYISREYFCDRGKETDRLLDSVKNKRNLTLYSLRRIGKTELIHHLFDVLRKRNNYSCYFVDLFPTTGISDFIKAFADALFKNVRITDKIFKEIKNLFKSLTPRISLNSYTGDPSFEFDFRSAEESRMTLEDIFEYLDKLSRKRNIVVAFDEFQQIVEYPQKNIEALLRSKIQSVKNITFIFSGSKKGMLNSMFVDTKRPFYQSTELMHLEKIDRNEYSTFIKDKFKEAKYKINDEAVDEILTWTRGHTYYVQYFCNRLFSSDIKKMELKDVINLENKILIEYKEFFIGLKNIFTSPQWKFLQSVAKEKYVISPTGKDFLLKYSLGAASSIKVIIDSLLSKEFIYKEDDKYFVYDIFLSHWLDKY
jgi:uncharacterized protein